MAESEPPRILVTRPAHQQAGFCAACEALGWQPVSLPTVTIEPMTLGLSPDHARQKLQDIKHRIDSHSGWIVFTSRNAVDMAHAIHALPWLRQTEDAMMLAIGPATVSALEQSGQPISTPPVSPYTSEAFCEWLLKQDPLPAHLMVVKGVGGRDLIKQQLQSNRIEVSNLDVYRRGLPALTERQLVHAFNPLPNIVSATSNEGLTNLITLAGPDVAAQLQQLPLVVNSQRMATHARQLGFMATVEVAIPPGDRGQLDGVQRCLQEVHSHR